MFSMANKRVFSSLLVLILLCTACGPRHVQSSSQSSSSSPAVSPQPSVSSDVPDVSPEEESLKWTTDPVLTDQQMPESYHGLELPIQGATGYTTVELPIWEHIEDSDAAEQAVEEWEKLQEEKAKAEAEAKAKAEAEAKAKAEAEAKAKAEAEAKAQAEAAAETQPEQTAPASSSASVSGTESDASACSSALSSTSSSPDPGSASSGTGSTSSSEVPSEPVPEPNPEPTPEPGSDTQSGTEPEPEPPTLLDGSLGVIPAGAAFTILQEDGEWWRVTCTTSYLTQEEEELYGTLTGWIRHKYCMINLPDVIPSIVYDATNAYSSLFVSCGHDLEGVTGTALYDGNKAFNPRLEQDEFLMPVLYSMSKRLAEAQRLALSEGNTLVLYEGFRPYSAQMQVVSSLRALLKEEPELKEQVTGNIWDISWFIATGVANHQQGYAVDVSVARVNSVRVHEVGAYRYTRVEEYELYATPTPIHELSQASATYTKPVSIFSFTAWEKGTLAPSMNEAALGLQGYCTQSGLTPLASEWWHFNDLNAYFEIRDNLGRGDFVIDHCCSTALA